MKFSVVAVLAAASSALAQTAGFDAISKPTEGQVLTAGEPFEIVWAPNGLAGTISIHLIQGTAANNLMMGPSVATGVNNLDGKYTWTQVPDAQYAAYGFNLTSDQDPAKYQLSFGFHIEGKSSSASSYPVQSYPVSTSAASGYPTSKPAPSYTSTITLSPGPSYSQYLTTSTPVSTYKPTYPASNSTWVASSTQPVGTGYPTSVAPVSSSGPTSTPSSPVQPGSATRFGASGLAAIAGLAMALAL